MKFRKKPVVIEAWQWDSNKKTLDILREVPGFNVAWIGHSESPSGMVITQLALKTLEGVMTASNGDWIIKGIAGEFYPCKPDIFELTYERVE